jgi:beta-lactamase superfamily II metal-dependent hydrolase
MEQNHLAAIEAGLTDPMAYLDHWYPGRDIFRLIVTHPDMDHMTGLHRLATQSRRTIYNFWHSGPADFNLAQTSEAEWQACRYDKRDWDTYKALRGSAASPKAHRKYANEKGQYWTDDGLIVLAPTPALELQAVQADEPNMISMALAVTHAGRTVVLGGDATADESWPAILQQFQVGVINVLKASHHGRKTGYHQPAVKAMSPWLTITSVGQAEHDATENYRRYSDYTVSLRDTGDIRITIDDDGSWTYWPDLSQHWKPKKVTLPPPPLPPFRLRLSSSTTE